MAARKPTTKGKTYTHGWYVCQACGVPRLQRTISDNTLAGLTKKKPAACIMTPRCKGVMVRQVTEAEAYKLMGLPAPEPEPECTPTPAPQRSAKAPARALSEQAGFFG